MPLNHFRAVGLGTRKYQQDQSPVKVCQEMLLPGCDCCRIGPCKLCLTWTVGSKVYLGKASGDDQEWSGSAGGVSFRAYWDESYCTINVELDGELVWTRSLCEDYDAVTCRNWDDETAFTTYAGDSGTFAWEVTEFLELLRRTGGEAYSESECADYWCGTCSCTCPMLCVTITTDDTDCEGTIPFTGEQCKDGRVTSPEWSGAIDCGPDDSVDVAIALTRDAYGDCQISGTVNGTIGDNAVALALVETPITDCKALATTWTVTADDITYTVAVRCLECGECGGISTTCCPDILLPETMFVDFIQVAPGADVSGPGSGDDCSCAEVTVPVYGGSLIGLGNGEGFWISDLQAWPCSFTGGPTAWQVTLVCAAGVWALAIAWYTNCGQLAIAGAPIRCTTYAKTTSHSLSQTCDPLELEFADIAPGDMFPSGICQGGITPAEMSAVVTA